MFAGIAMAGANSSCMSPRSGGANTVCGVSFCLLIVYHIQSAFVNIKNAGFTSSLCDMDIVSLLYVLEFLYFCADIRRYSPICKCHNFV